MDFAFEPLLPPLLSIPARSRRHLAEDYERFALEPYPGPPAAYVRERYDLDLTARLGPFTLLHPLGKASGQLSLNEQQILADAEAGLAFAVLKTVIAESPGGRSRMAPWKVQASRMVCERITSRRGEPGWTVTWLGRGWEGTLKEYARFTTRALATGADHGLPVLPSVKFHLPAAPGEPYDEEEYAHTLHVLLAAARDAGAAGPLAVEKDFSPTLAGSDRARHRDSIFRWIEEVPRLVRAHSPPGVVHLGLKLMNALFDDAFQLEMVRRAHEADPPPAFLTLFNRLFDPERSFEGQRGVAYGGFDLSDRNLRVLERWALEGPLAGAAPGVPDISATGNIASGRLMAEYALRGATSGQIHTFFQLPRTSYRSPLPRSRAALHELLFHPETGLVASLEHLRLAAGTRGQPFRFLDLPPLGRRLLAERHGGERAEEER